MAVINGNYREYKLENGLSVALQETPTQTIRGSLFVNCGRVHDPEGKEGLSHNLEHNLITGGTEKYSPEEVLKIRAEIAYTNAETSLNQMGFPVDMLSEDLEKYLDLISQITLSPRFDEKKLEEERQRILREISRKKGRPAYQDETEFRRKVFGDEHPFTLETLGKESVIETLAKTDFSEHHKYHFGASNMQLVLVGGLPANTEELIKQYFAEHPAGQNRKFEFLSREKLEQRIVQHTHAPDLCDRENPSESNSDIYLWILAPPKKHPDFYNLYILSSILGDVPNGRIFHSISQEKGLAYEIGAKYDGKNNNGAVIVGGKVLSKRQDEAIDAIFEELRKLEQYPVSEKEVSNIQKEVIFGMAKLYETNEGHMNAITVKLEDGITPQDVIEGIKRVTPQTLQKTAIKYLPSSREDNNYALSIRDPLKR